MAEQGYRVSPNLVGRLLKDLGFSLQANAKTREGRQHPDRDAQFQHINDAIERFRRTGQPAISVDTKKKELVGDFKNAGRELRRKGQPEEVRVHDFIIPGKGRAVPYGVYDIAANEGWVSVGIDHDTAAFAVESIRRWWRRMGRKRYPTARRLLITADCGGSNGARVRLWKVELQKLADQTGLTITVAHHPPGTSKWNRIEHRMFAFITQNWRGKPLLTHKVIVQLIAATTTTLRPHHRLRHRRHSISRRATKVSDPSSKRSRSNTTTSIRSGTTPYLRGGLSMLAVRMTHLFRDRPLLRNANSRQTAGARDCWPT